MKSGEIEEKELIIGIDLGTTNSLVAYVKNGETKIVKDDSGKSSLVPSIVHFTEEGDIIVGQEAKSKLIAHPNRTIYSVKRLLGKSYQDIKNYNELLSYEIIDEKDKLVKVKMGDQFHSPVSLSAEILKYLKQRIESHLSKKVSKAVITVPAYFNDSQRQATRDAGKIAGLDILRIVNEPTAASLAYGIGLKDGENENIAVYDLGGGTFDISILSISDGIFDVRSTNGDTFLGGDDFDRKIIDFWIKENDIDVQTLSSDKSLGQSVRLIAEEAKKHLSFNDKYTSKDGSFSIDKSQFEALINPIIVRTIDKTKAAIKDAEIDINDIDKVILVGGSTRVPAVKKAVADLFGKEPFDKLNPDEVVAMGAALQADILAGNTKGYLLLDITPLSLGIETVGGLMDPIIPRNSKVPVSAGRSYTTSVDGQKNLKISVYQGERELVEHNRKLGEFILKDIPPMAAGIPKIEVHFIIDADGILRVRAKEGRSGVETEVEIKSQYGISEEEMGKMLLESMKNAESDMKVKALKEATNEARSIILSAKKFINQNNDILSEQEIAEINTHIGLLEKASNGDDKNAVNKAMHDFNAYSAPLAQRAMDHNISLALKGKKL